MSAGPAGHVSHVCRPTYRKDEWRDDLPVPLAPGRRHEQPVGRGQATDGPVDHAAGGYGQAALAAVGAAERVEARRQDTAWKSCARVCGMNALRHSRSRRSVMRAYRMGAISDARNQARTEASSISPNIVRAVRASTLSGSRRCARSIRRTTGCGYLEVDPEAAKPAAAYGRCTRGLQRTRRYWCGVRGRAIWPLRGEVVVAGGAGRQLLESRQCGRPMAAGPAA
jgi:hypothetical protein